MELLIIACLVSFLVVILYLCYQLIRWAFDKKSRARVFLIALSTIGLALLIHHFFFKKMEFIQSEVYPELYLIKNPAETKEL